MSPALFEGPLGRRTGGRVNSQIGIRSSQAGTGGGLARNLSGREGECRARRDGFTSSPQDCGRRVYHKRGRVPAVATAFLLENPGTKLQNSRTRSTSRIPLSPLRPFLPPACRPRQSSSYFHFDGVILGRRRRATHSSSRDNWLGGSSGNGRSGLDSPPPCLSLSFPPFLLFCLSVREIKMSFSDSSDVFLSLSECRLRSPL